MVDENKLGDKLRLQLPWNYIELFQCLNEQSQYFSYIGTRLVNSLITELNLSTIRRECLFDTKHTGFLLFQTSLHNYVGHVQL